MVHQAYERPSLALSSFLGLSVNPRGIIAVEDKNGKITKAQWPEDDDVSDLAELFDDSIDNACEVNDFTARVLTRHGIEPTVAGMVEFMVEHELSYRLELLFDPTDGPLHHASITAGNGSNWRIVGSVADVDYPQALAMALAGAIETCQLGRWAAAS